MYKFPQFSRTSLDNGLQIVYIPDSEQQAVTVAMQIRVGEFSDPVSLEGVAGLTVSLLQKGSAGLTAEQFADRLERTGTSLFAETGDEHIVIGFKTLSRHAKSIMLLFRDMLCSPGFDKRELARLKKELITSLQAETSDANSLANRHFFSHLCGKNHPAGRLHTIQSVKKIDISHIRSFYSSFFTPANCMLVIAGHFSQSEGCREWSDLFSSWNSVKTVESCIAGQIPALAETSIRLVDKADITQTYFILGHPAPGELIPDRNALALANYCLGGGNFSSRLMDKVRSAKGKTYGISSQISCNKICGIFMISTATQSAQATEVLGTIFDVYKKFSEDGITAAELEKAREFAIGNMAFQLEGICNIVDKFLGLNLYDRDISYMENFDSAISAISLDDVNEAIRKYLSSKYFSIVAVGKKEEIYNQLSAFGKVTCMNFRARA
ncbi:MAG TPA: hypothetical protein DCO75_11995 [Fibrobacteres bacterium]|nr:hypothetical protein [Fibrobacterota bacterium]